MLTEGALGVLFLFGVKSLPSATSVLAAGAPFSQPNHDLQGFVSFGLAGTLGEYCALRTYETLMKNIATPQTSRRPTIAPTFNADDVMLSWMFGARGRMTPKKTKVSASKRTQVAVTISASPEVAFIARSDWELCFKSLMPGR